MTEEEKEHTKKTGIYVDLQMLAQCIYHLLYEMPKKDRVVLGDKIFNSCVDSLSYFREAFKNMEMCKIYGMVRWDNKRRCFNLMEKYNVKNTFKRKYLRRKWI